MQTKNTRGVQQEEIWEAADTLLAAGLRPTIERVRQHLGRGSPNTVAPMLETWFAGLGKRLGMTGDRAGDIPPAATQAMAKLWNAALLAARKEVDAALAQERLTLETADAALSERESSMAQQEQAFIQRQEMADQLLQAEREKTAGVEAALAVAQEQLAVRDGSVNELRSALASAQEHLQRIRNHSDVRDRRHNDERAKWEERAAGNERRLLGEIERERQATKEISVVVAKVNVLLQTTRSDLESRNHTLVQRLQGSEIELGTTLHALASSESRCTELADLLKEQRTANGTLLKQFNQTLTTLSRNTVPAKRKASGGRAAANQ